ncbi:DUF6298 domain-containing protein [Desertivirga brevis]|uniref:DUF6298 domain-containing protein n=1 Tax=Desertivirga brevis TaxID=2810310 RepID=UPI001A96DF0C|nr:DUF6298 domain-containing protein [Pedobacter sp. SYSU D00873]
MKKLFGSLILLLVSLIAQTQTKDDKTRIAIDYSLVGYKESLVPVPLVPVTIVVKSSGNDDTQLLQAAIDKVASLPLASNGFRGCIALSPGRFSIAGALNISADGIVIRGGSPANTVLVATGIGRRSLINVAGKVMPAVEGPRVKIDGEVNAGAVSFKVENVGSLKVGDLVQITRPSTKEWISTLGMDTLKGVFPDLRYRWTPGSRDLKWYRVISAVNTATGVITVDAPITTAIEQRFGGATVEKVYPGSFLENVGLENFTIESSFNKLNLKDEEHAWYGITLDNVSNGWVRDIKGKYLVSSLVHVTDKGRKITIENCSNQNPVSEIGGYRRNAFWIEGQQVLVRNCNSDSGVNDFAIGFCAAGPNVFYNCTATNALGASGSFESWSSGVLYENVEISGNALKVSYDTKRAQESGWTAANSILYNCKASTLEAGGHASAPNYIINAKYPLFEAQLTARLGKQATADFFKPQAPGYSEASGAAQAFNYSPAELATPKGVVEANKVSIMNGRFVISDQTLWGGSVNDAWWLGKTIPASALDAGVSISRFVPGKIGAGLTEDLPVLAERLKQQDIDFYQSGPAIWYDRRRDEHSITERLDGNVWAAFYELPWARSGEGKAWDGLSKFDLAKYNPWYFNRMKEFAAQANQKGFLMYHHFYNNHNLQETASHWADFPWRPANNINNTGLPEPPPLEPRDRVHVTNKFYDASNPLLAELHRNYIFHVLDELGSSPNVIFGLSFQYSGPLSFQKFFQQTVLKWEKTTGKRVPLVIATGKEVTDSILSDPELSKQIAVVDMRYWHYLPDGSLWAPKAGQNLAFRELHPREFGDPTTPQQIYRQVREYHDKFPDKAIVAWHAGADQVAALMGGAAQVLTQNPTAGHGQGRVLDKTSFDIFVNKHISLVLMKLQPLDHFVSDSETTWVLSDSDEKNLIIYSLTGTDINFVKSLKLSNYKALWYNPSNDTEKEAKFDKGNLKSIAKPDDKDWLLVLQKQR